MFALLEQTNDGDFGTKENILFVTYNENKLYEIKRMLEAQLQQMLLAKKHFEDTYLAEFTKKYPCVIEMNEEYMKDFNYLIENHQPYRSPPDSSTNYLVEEVCVI